MSPSIEASKRTAAGQAVKENFPPDPQFVGIGSGTTIVYVVEAIKALDQDVSRVCFVPTGSQSRQLIIDAGFNPVQFDSIPETAVLDVSFDGADEVDEELNCIKGGGACLFQEKLVAMRSKKFICVADHRKLQSRLLTSWPSIPVEVAPIAVKQVLRRLGELGSHNPTIRESHPPNSGPLKTDQDFFIIDAPFPRLLISSDLGSGTSPINKNTTTSNDDDNDDNDNNNNLGPRKDGSWVVEHLANEIKRIEGVLEVGIFSGRTGQEATESGTMGGQRPVACYFGMEDGSVTVRRASPKTGQP